MMALVPFLVLPISALVAILVIVLLLRGEELDDSSLMLSFGSLFATCVILSYGLLQTQWLQFKLDPRLEQVAILRAHPVFQGLELSPDRHRQLMDALVGDVAEGTPVQDALDQALPALAAVARERMGFAGADANGGHADRCDAAVADPSSHENRHSWSLSTDRDDGLRHSQESWALVTFADRRNVRIRLIC